METLAPPITAIIGFSGSLSARVNAFNSFIEVISLERKLSDDQIECMQFGICDYTSRKVEELPFFHS